jgi:hypothetical protein
MGATLIPIPLMLLHLTRYVLCGSVEKFTDSLVKEIVNVQQGDVGGQREGRGEKWRQWKWGLSPSIVRCVFLIFEHSQVLTNTEKEEGNNGSDFKPKPGSHFDKGFSSW